MKNNWFISVTFDIDICLTVHHFIVCLVEEFVKYVDIHKHSQQVLSDIKKKTFW